MTVFNRLYVCILTASIFHFFQGLNSPHVSFLLHKLLSTWTQCWGRGKGGTLDLLKKQWFSLVMQCLLIPFYSRIYSSRTGFDSTTAILKVPHQVRSQEGQEHLLSLHSVIVQNWSSIVCTVFLHIFVNSSLFSAAVVIALTPPSSFHYRQNYFQRYSWSITYLNILHYQSWLSLNPST